MTSALRHACISKSTGLPGSNLTCGGHTSVTQELIPVKPSADWGLTRGGAHSQWPRGLVRASLALIKRATSAVAGVSPATTQNAAETHRGGSGFVYTAPFGAPFGSTESWRDGASDGRGLRAWGGRSRRRRARLRPPELG